MKRHLIRITIGIILGILFYILFVIDWFPQSKIAWLILVNYLLPHAKKYSKAYTLPHPKKYLKPI